MTDRFLTRPEAVDYVRQKGLPVTKFQLAKLAVKGGGPRYRMFGTRSVYTERDLDEWIEQKLSTPRRSTSERHAGVEG